MKFLKTFHGQLITILLAIVIAFLIVSIVTPKPTITLSVLPDDTTITSQHELFDVWFETSVAGPIGYYSYSPATNSLRFSYEHGNWPPMIYKCKCGSAPTPTRLP